MTRAFNEFMRQYKMTGSEKADGYSCDVFLGLDEVERTEVFEILLTELPYSIEWLFVLDSQKALGVAKKNEEQWRGDGYKRVYMLQEEIIKQTGDLSYQSRMIEDYPGYVDYLRPLVVDSISRTTATMAVVNFLKQVILTETSDDAVARASRKLLAALKFPRDTENNEMYYKMLVRELRGESTKLKLQALSRISKYEKNLPL
jgi:hypothetical protein